MDKPANVDAMQDLEKRVLPELREAQLHRTVARLNADVTFQRTLLISLGVVTAFLVGYILREI